MQGFQLIPAVFLEHFHRIPLTLSELIRMAAFVYSHIGQVYSIFITQLLCLYRIMNDK